MIEWLRAVWMNKWGFVNAGMALALLGLVWRKRGETTMKHDILEKFLILRLALAVVLVVLSAAHLTYHLYLSGKEK